MIEKKDILIFKEKLKSTTLIQMRNPEFNAEMTRLYVLVGDLVTMVRRPSQALSSLDRQTQNKATERANKRRKEETK